MTNQERQQLIDDLANKYTKSIDNIQWHINTNKPTGEALADSKAAIQVYEQILYDIEPLRSKADQQQVQNQNPKQKAGCHGSNKRNSPR